MGSDGDGRCGSGTERSATAEEIREYEEEHDEPHPIFEVEHRPERERVFGECDHPHVEQHSDGQRQCRVCDEILDEERSLNTDTDREDHQ